jgi:hypothetical protein
VDHVKLVYAYHWLAGAGLGILGAVGLVKGDSVSQQIVDVHSWEPRDLWNHAKAAHDWWQSLIAVRQSREQRESIWIGRALPGLMVKVRVCVGGKGVVHHLGQSFCPLQVIRVHVANGARLMANLKLTK